MEGEMSVEGDQVTGLELCNLKIQAQGFWVQEGGRKCFLLSVLKAVLTSEN